MPEDRDQLRASELSHIGEAVPVPAPGSQLSCPGAAEVFVSGSKVAIVAPGGTS